jgi:MauM/NapG family ferredoxin protein
VIPFQRLVQAIFLVVFLLLVLLTLHPGGEGVPAGRFLLLDPVLALGAMLSSRSLLAPALLLPTLVVLIGTVLLGRIFCSHICPLGTLQDLAAPLMRRKSVRAQPDDAWRRVKYLVLAALAVAALWGVNLTLFAAPLALASRLVVLVLLPGLQFLLMPLALLPGVDTLLPERAFQPLRYSTLLFHVLFFSALFGALAAAPRFWCRYLCPTGAVLALVGRFPLLPRRVGEACTRCGSCQTRCPMGAIEDSRPDHTVAGECITCTTCSRICPEQAVSFALQGKGPLPAQPAMPTRRQAGMALAGGFLLAFTARRGLGEYWPEGESGNIMPEGLVRPPGALPENEFLRLCTRCGLCIKACPTNMLQPAGWSTGLSPLFSPLAVSRRGPCAPECSLCGQVCPTRALRPLSLEEKSWAKMGTARIIPGKCIAWEFEKPCLICDEACPYDAIRLVSVPGVRVAVPVVDEHKCAGCGWCEFRCPVVASSAVLVEPMGALRLRQGEDYPRRARELGLDIRLADQREAPGDSWTGEEGSLPPGFSE